MCAYQKLLDKRPEAIIGYKIARALEQRQAWMEMARDTQFPASRTERVRLARERNRELIRHLRVLDKVPAYLKSAGFGEDERCQKRRTNQPNSDVGRETESASTAGAVGNAEPPNEVLQAGAAGLHIACLSDQPRCHMDEWKKFRVELRSRPGMWTHYSGHVDVYAPDIDSAFDEAVKKLARTSFPDRPSPSSWMFLGASAL